MRRKQTAEALLRLTRGVIGSSEILILFSLHIAFPLAGITTNDVVAVTNRDLRSIFQALTPKTIKKALYNLTFNGQVKRITKAGKTEYAITEAGRVRLKAALPAYRSIRQWDGHVFLMAYDMPHTSNDKRERLRKFFRSLGSVILHDSLWLHPYDQTRILSAFVKRADIPGNVFIVKLGTDGSLGKESLAQILSRVYRMDMIKNRYERYHNRYCGKRNIDRFEAALEYLSILRDDPQLPFPMEPHGFPAKKSHALYLALQHQV